MTSRLPQAVERLPERVRVAASLEAMETRERRVLELLLLERLTVIETAGVLRMSARQVEQTLALAMHRISVETGAGAARERSRRAA